MNALIVALLLSNGKVTPAVCPPPPPPCEKTIRVKLSEISFTLNIWKHIKNAANAVEFTLPVSCTFYDQVNVGDNLLKKQFRWGSLAVGGTFGNWNIEVIGK